MIFPHELVKPDGTPVEVYTTKGIGQQAAFFYETDATQEECNIHTEILESEIFVDVLIIAAAVFFCALILYCMTACSYSSLSRSYEKLQKYRRSQQEWAQRYGNRNDEERGGSVLSAANIKKGVGRLSKDLKMAVK